MAPFLPFFAGALALLLLGSRFRAPLLLGVPLAGAASLAGLDDGASWSIQWSGMELTPLRVDGLSLMFGWLFHLAAFLAALFALHLRDRVQHVAALVYAGAALGAVFAGDLLTLFVFWELMALSSACLIWARRSPGALRAGLRYLLTHILSGVLLLAGALVYARTSGSLAFGQIGADSIAGGTAAGGVRDQVRVSPGAQLADRCLSGSDADRHRVPQHVHHQGRGVRARPRLSGHGSCSSTSAWR